MSSSPPISIRRIGRRSLELLRPSALVAVAVTTLAAACSHHPPFDSVAHLRAQIAERLAAAEDVEADAVDVPFALSEELAAHLDRTQPRRPDERYRVERLLDFVFRDLDLAYARLPTRDAAGTYATREANCLSFVNLFVGVARHRGLDPFYVEVVDHERWSHERGMVLSQGHIVAGLYVDGELATYDFLPYRPRSYRQLRRIDDLTATAHYYNNLGAEALLAGDRERATELLEIAAALAPRFPKALNNLGVVRARGGDPDGALDAYRRGLQVDRDDVPLLSNLARLHQQRGDIEAAAAALRRIEAAKTTNPFYFVYRGELELARGDAAAALESLRHAFRLDSELPEVHVGLADVYLALGDLQRARHHVDRALGLDAGQRDARRLDRMLAAGDATPRSRR